MQPARRRCNERIPFATHTYTPASFLHLSCAVLKAYSVPRTHARYAAASLQRTRCWQRAHARCSREPRGAARAHLRHEYSCLPKCWTHRTNFYCFCDRSVCEKAWRSRKRVAQATSAPQPHACGCAKPLSVCIRVKVWVETKLDDEKSLTNRQQAQQR